MDLPRPLSHSSLSMYGECPLRYKLKYVDRIPEKPKHFFSFGRSMHKALEFFYGVEAPPAPPLELLLKNYEAGWESAGYRDQVQESEYFQDGKDILTGYYGRHASTFQVPLYVEFRFDMEVDGVPVTGFVDRIDRLPDGRLSVLDYKTGKKLAGGRIQSDAQLTMYQLGCETKLGTEVGRLVFYHLPSFKEHAVDRRPQGQVDELRRRIVATAESIRAGRFEAKLSEDNCRWCDFKDHCPDFIAFRAPAAAAPAAAGKDELAELIDRYGELKDRLAQAEREAFKVKEAILAILRRKGYVRAFGARYEILRSGSEKFEFPESNKKKVLRLLREAGLYDRVLAPSGPLIQKLLNDPGTEAELRAALRELGSRVEPADLTVNPL